MNIARDLPLPQQVPSDGQRQIGAIGSDFPTGLAWFAGLAVVFLIATRVASELLLRRV